jgi:hypothetical protein
MIEQNAASFPEAAFFCAQDSVAARRSATIGRQHGQGSAAVHLQRRTNLALNSKTSTARGDSHA